MLKMKHKTRISEKFDQLKKRGEKAFIPYITAGDPSLEETAEIVYTLEKAGADIIELGIPFSDPLADGPIIQKAAARAIENGANVDKIFDLVEDIRDKTEIPLVFLIYFNTIFQYGVHSFLEKCKKVGVDGLIIPDLPLEERGELMSTMESYPIDLIPLVAITSGDRIKDVVDCGSGFVYCISSKGVTGKRTNFDEGLSQMMKKVRGFTDLPLAIGFGISDRNAIHSLKGFADGLIVGSAIVEQIDFGRETDDIHERLLSMVEGMKEAMK